MDVLKICNFFEDYQVLARYYDTVRLVSVKDNQVLYLQETHKAEGELLKQESCFCCWDKDEPCSNCISLNAAKQKEKFMKIECVANKTFLVEAVPVEQEDGSIVVLELVKELCQLKLKEDLFPAWLRNKAESLGIKKALFELNESVTRDALTNLFNRRYMDERIQQDFELATLQDREISVVMIDIDHFKRINDFYGHAVGDEILKQISSCFVEYIRQDKLDWIARYGGDEFIICLPQCNLQNAVIVAKRILLSISNFKFQTSCGSIRLTASAGVGSYPSTKGSVAELLKATDEGLYKAKNEGRNKVVALS